LSAFHADFQATSLDLATWSEETDYGDICCDDVFEYRQVIVPFDMVSVFPRDRCMAEAEWRGVGICMSRGWEHYELHSPQPNVLLFRRAIGTNPTTGFCPPEIKRRVEERLAYIAWVEAAMRARRQAAQAEEEEAMMVDTMDDIY